MDRLTEAEIRRALKYPGIEVTVKYDYTPSPEVDKAICEEIEFTERAWRALLLVATNRCKSSRKLNETQIDIKRHTYLDERGLRVRVLTLNAALRLQDAGYALNAGKADSITPPIRSTAKGEPEDLLRTQDQNSKRHERMKCRVAAKGSGGKGSTNPPGSD